MHLILFPLAIIITSILIEKFSSTMSKSIFLKSFISATCFILFDNKFYLSIILILRFFRLIRSLLIHFNNCRVVFILITNSRRRSYLDWWWWCRNCFRIWSLGWWKQYGNWNWKLLLCLCRYLRNRFFNFRQNNLRYWIISKVFISFWNLLNV